MTKTAPLCLLQRVQCCEACGQLVHEGCARSAKPDCRPAAVNCDKLLHMWQASGTVYEYPEVRMGCLPSVAVLG